MLSATSSHYSQVCESTWGLSGAIADTFSSRGPSSKLILAMSAQYQCEVWWPLVVEHKHLSKWWVPLSAERPPWLGWLEGCSYYSREQCGTLESSWRHMNCPGGHFLRAAGGT